MRGRQCSGRYDLYSVWAADLSAHERNYRWNRHADVKRFGGRGNPNSRSTVGRSLPGRPREAFVVAGFSRPRPWECEAPAEQNGAIATSNWKAFMMQVAHALASVATARVGDPSYLPGLTGTPPSGTISKFERVTGDPAP